MNATSLVIISETTTRLLSEGHSALCFRNLTCLVSVMAPFPAVPFVWDTLGTTTQRGNMYNLLPDTQDAFWRTLSGAHRGPTQSSNNIYLHLSNPFPSTVLFLICGFLFPLGVASKVAMTCFKVWFLKIKKRKSFWFNHTRVPIPFVNMECIL